MMRKVVDGTFSFDEESPILPAVEEVEKIYCARLERTFDCMRETIGQKEVHLPTVYGAFSLEKVPKAMGGISKDSTPGVDGWNLSAIKKLSAGNVTALFNFWWAHRIPVVVQVCKTILLPKGGEQSDVNNWQPITIGNLLMRLYVSLGQTNKI